MYFFRRPPNPILLLQAAGANSPGWNCPMDIVNCPSSSIGLFIFNPPFRSPMQPHWDSERKEHCMQTAVVFLFFIRFSFASSLVSKSVSQWVDPSFKQALLWGLSDAKASPSTGPCQWCVRLLSCRLSSSSSSQKVAQKSVCTFSKSKFKRQFAKSNAVTVENALARRVSQQWPAAVSSQTHTRHCPIAYTDPQSEAGSCLLPQLLLLWLVNCLLHF